MFQTMLYRKPKRTLYVNNFFSENCTVYEITWKNIVETGRLLMTILCMHIACLIPEATNTHSVYVMLFLLHHTNGCANAPQCYVTRTLPVLLKQISSSSLWLLSIQFLCEIIMKFSWNTRLCPVLYPYLQTAQNVLK